MKAVGIVVEYNPFHNGHLYHLTQVKKRFKDYPIIAVMTGYFNERGEVSIISKWSKAEIALKMGVDLVIELPFAFASQSADIFAKGAIQILKQLDCEYIVFGSECNNINKLTTAASILADPACDVKIKEYLNTGVNYPTSISKAVMDLTKIRIDQPNDLLGISYIKEIKKQNAKIKSICIKRSNNYHAFNQKDNIVSASAIRHSLDCSLDVSHQIPPVVNSYLLNGTVKLDNYYNLLKYKILSENNLALYQTVDEGLENRVKKYIHNANNFESLIKLIKTKRYTYNKINRMLIHILVSFTKEEAKQYRDITYLRILGFNKTGKNYLNQIKKMVTVPIISNVTKKNANLIKLDLRISEIYTLGLTDSLGIDEYKQKPIIL